MLEASAGTGKTFTIANLVARYVADGVAMEELLVVSFSRESTRELRERVRERLVSARDGLTEPAVVPDDDLVLRLLADDCDSAEVGVRRKLFEEALTVFDAATVTTTHGFCQQVLLALGTAGDHDTGAVLVESIADLVAEVADDLYLRKWGVERARPAGPGPGCLPRAGDGRGTSTRPPSCCPTRRPTGRPASARGSRWPCAPRSTDASGAQQIIDYDDMLTRLATTLTDEGTGPGRAATAAGRATGWCSSTSSRTPTRCSGRSCARPSTATARWCSSATRSRRSTASAAPTCTPTSRLARRRRWCARCRPTTAATPACSTG